MFGTLNEQGRRSILMWVVFFVPGLLLLSWAAERLVLARMEDSWEAIVEAKSRQYLIAAEEAFTGVQRHTRRIATELAGHKAVVGLFSGQTTDTVSLFSHVAKTSRSYDIGVEVFDRRGVLVAWDGQSEPSHTREVLIALDGQLTSYVTPGPVYSQLFVACPIRHGAEIIGVVLVRNAIEVNYPIHNKFIRRQGLAEQLTSELGVPVSFDFSPAAEPRRDGRYSSATLRGIDGNIVGVVSVQRPMRSAFLDQTATLFRGINAVLLVVLLGSLSLALGSRIITWRSLVWKSVALTVLIWLVRYALLVLEVPSSFVSSGIFDPTFFASKFGGGLAKSIGETTMTVGALVLNIALVANMIVRQGAELLETRIRGGPVVRVSVALVLTGLVFALLRGYGATVRSAVFDSTLRFNDPYTIIPGIELGLMFLILFALSFSLLVAVVGIALFIRSLLAGVWSTRASWVITAVMLLTASVIVGWVQENPLSSTVYRLFFAAVVIGLAIFFRPRGLNTGSIVRAGDILIVCAIAVLLLYPLLVRNVADKDRARIQMFAHEVIRPVDGWLKFVVQDALQGFRHDDVVAALMGGREDELDRLAFAAWARSLASREGYNCLFLLQDADGRTIDRFSIGGATAIPGEEAVVLRAGRDTTISVSEIGSGVNARKVYAGSTVIRGETGAVLARAIVAIAAGQQSLFRGESPAILRAAMHETVESFYRPMIISEYHGGVIYTSNTEDRPFDHRLPPEIMDAFEDPVVMSVWGEEVMGGRDYETFYLRRLPGDDRIIALSVARYGFALMVFTAIKVMVYYGVVLAIGFAGSLGFRYLKGERYRLTFRDRLLGALVVTAVLPIVLVAFYGRDYATERFVEGLERQLKQETATVGAVIVQRAERREGDLHQAITVQTADQLAANIGADFNVYVQGQLFISSRPELFEAGILDRRLRGSAHAALHLNGERFYMETETIGLYRYVVGYRPLVGQDGTMLGVVSVPTLYRQDQIDAEVAESNGFLFTVMAFVLLLIVGVATTFANRIAAPIHTLTEATRRVAAGDLDVEVRVPHAEGEIGELVNSFDAMTRNLKRSRDELVRYERDLAWKEMAKQVAHEIKNPLTPMKLSLQHLRQTYRDRVPDFDRVFDEVSRTIIEQIDALSRIASEFSAFARMPVARMEACDVHKILLESIHLFERDGVVTFRTELAPALPPVTADAEQLRAAFINIIRNAVQAMGGSGTIEVSTQRNGATVGIAIRDFGPGIPEEMKGKLFQPNFSTKTDGMGLGLAIVKKTIDDVHGMITIESTPGSGTTVKIELPASAEQ